MMRPLQPDVAAARAFLARAYSPHDWLAVFLKASGSNRAFQRIGPRQAWSETRWLLWLHAMQLHGFNVYISVNTVVPRQWRRTRDVIAAVRHVFLDADRDGLAVLSAIERRPDLPSPSYVLHSSPNRVHIFWRVSGFSRELVERTQRQLARELGTDQAATPCSQTTRLPGFWNMKYRPPHQVIADYRELDAVCGPAAFPIASMSKVARHATPPFDGQRSARPADGETFERARRYLAAVPAAVSGQGGDVHMFRVCFRIVRGFALNEDDAFVLLTEWNARCEPPWSERDLRDKLRRAARYGQEPLGAYLSQQDPGNPDL